MDKQKIRICSNKQNRRDWSLHVVRKVRGGETQTGVRKSKQDYSNVSHRAGITGEEREGKFKIINIEVQREKGGGATATNPTETNNSRESGTQVQPKSPRAPDNPDTDRGGTGPARVSNGEEKPVRESLEEAKSCEIPDEGRVSHRPEGRDPPGRGLE